MAKDKAVIMKMIEELKALDTSKMYLNDFFHTWKESDDEIAAVFKVAEILRGMRENNISAKVFDSGLGISIFRDNSTRTRFSFASACNLLGLEVQDLDEKVSQIAHGETVRETANMISFMADVIGIRDDMYIGKGYTYMKSVSEAVQEGYRDGVLEQRPTLVNLQCDIDHPTQFLADMMTAMEHTGKGPDSIKFAYIGDGRNNVANALMIGSSILGSSYSVASPESLFPEPTLLEKCRSAAAGSNGSITLTTDPFEAVKGADVIYTDIWCSMGEEDKMQERIELLKPYQVTMDLLKASGNDDVLFEHCLPSFHDLNTTIGKEVYEKFDLKEMEVSDEVFRSRHSVVFDEAENRMHTIKAVMVATLSDKLNY